MQAQIKAYDTSPALKQMQAQMKAYDSSSALKLAQEQMKVFDTNPALKKMQAQIKAYDISPALKQMQAQMKVFDTNPALKKMQAQIKAYDSSSALKLAQEQMKVFNSNSAIKLSEQITSMTGFQSIAEMYKEQKQALERINDVREILKTQNHGISNVIDIKEHLSKQGVQLSKFSGLEPLIAESISIEEQGKGENSKPIILNGFYELFLSALESKIANILLMAFFTVFLNLVSSYVYENYVSAQNELKQATNKQEVKSLIRKAKNFDKSALQDYRVISGDNLYIRKLPSMKGEVITKLKVGSLVEVLDKSNKSWLFVEYDSENMSVTGWVSRKYTFIIK